MVLPIVLIGITSIAMLLIVALTYAWCKLSACERSQAEMLTRLETAEKQLALVNQTALPIFTAFQAILRTELTHYHEPHIDALMVKLGPPWTLTESEETELIQGLETRTRDMSADIPDSERDAARMLLLVMKRAKAETLLARDTPLELRIVTFTTPLIGESTKAAYIRSLLGTVVPQEG